MAAVDQNREQWFDTLRTSVGQSEKSWVITFCLSLFLGYFGADRFYLSSIGLGSLKLITFGGFGYWWIADVVWLLLGKMKDGHGGIVRRPF